MIAVGLALLSALSFATSTVVQHRAATSAVVAPGRRAALRLAARLVRTPAWLAGQGAAACGFALHGLALRFGPVTLVQPLLSSGLVLTLALGALVDRRHPDRPLPGPREWLSAVVVALGVFTFLVSAAPHGGHRLGSTPVLLSAAGAAFAALAAAFTGSRRPAAAHRALALGLAAGLGFGVTGVLLKEVVHRPPTSWSAIWTLLLMVAIGGCSIVAAQTAYQAGRLIESLPSLTVTEPVVAVTLAALAFDELLRPGWLAHTGQVVGLLVLALGVVDLARRSHAPLDPEPIVLPPVVDEARPRAG
ncbi:MAG: DMT family transporter [Kineosporiaceae bacterium]